MKQFKLKYGLFFLLCIFMMGCGPNCENINVGLCYEMTTKEMGEKVKECEELELKPVPYRYLFNLDKTYRIECEVKEYE